MTDLCTTCAHRKTVPEDPFLLLCEYGFTGALQFDEETDKVIDCDDYDFFPEKYITQA